MIKFLFKKLGVSASRKELQRYVRFLRTGKDYEVGTVWASACLARKVLIESPVEGLEFPNEYLDGEVQIDRDASFRLMRYNLQLVRTKSILAQSSNPIHEYYVSGLAVWIMTLRSVYHFNDPYLFTLGREVWQELGRGIDDLAGCILELSPEATDEDRLQYAPALLAPALAESMSAVFAIEDD